MAQVVVTDEALADRGRLVTAQMGLWTSLFVLSTLLINAPTIPALLRYTRLNQARRRNRAAPGPSSTARAWLAQLARGCASSNLRLPTRTGFSGQAQHPAEGPASAAEVHRIRHPGVLAHAELAALGHVSDRSWLSARLPIEQALKADEDEMLRGVDWGAVARYVDLSDELQQFSRSASRDGATAPHGAPLSLASQPRLPLDQQQAGAGAEAQAAGLEQRDELFAASGWAAPSRPRASAGSRQAAALRDLG